MFTPVELKALVTLNRQVLEKLDDLDSRVNHSNETLDMINQNLEQILNVLKQIATPKRNSTVHRHSQSRLSDPCDTIINF